MSIRVYSEDVDWFGIVYYANYLKYMERGRTEYLRHFGLDQEQLLHDGFIFPARKVEVEYLRSARFNDALLAHTEVVEFGRASMVFKQSVEEDKRDQNTRNIEPVKKATTLNKNATPIIYCTSYIKVACVNRDFKPCAIPEHLMEAIRCD